MFCIQVQAKFESVFTWVPLLPWRCFCDRADAVRFARHVPNSRVARHD